MTDFQGAGSQERAGRLAGRESALRASDSGIAFQGARFALAGAIVTVVYLGVTTLLATVFGIHFQVALIIGFSCGLVVHFTLQRQFVWAHGDEYALPIHRQAGRYLIVAAAQYGVTAASTALLPSALGVPTEVVYLATVFVVVCTNFVVFRQGIFHARPTDAPSV